MLRALREHVVTMNTDISALFQISVNLIMEVVQMWHTSFVAPPGQPEPDAGNDAGGYRPRHRPQDEA